MAPESTTHGFQPYIGAIEAGLSDREGYAQLVRVYASDREGEARYSSPDVVGAVPTPIFGGGVAVNREPGFSVLPGNTPRAPVILGSSGLSTTLVLSALRRRRRPQVRHPSRVPRVHHRERHRILQPVVPYPVGIVRSRRQRVFLRAQVALE